MTKRELFARLKALPLHSHDIKHTYVYIEDLQQIINDLAADIDKENDFVLEALDKTLEMVQNEILTISLLPKLEQLPRYINCMANFNAPHVADCDIEYSENEYISVKDYISLIKEFKDAAK